jgi:hypothetical protein
VILVPNDQAPEAEQPTDRAFDCPAPFVAPKRTSILGRRFDAVVAVWTDQFGSTAGQACAERVAVGRAVVEQSRQTTTNHSFLQKWLDQSNFVGAGTDNIDAERQASSVNEHHDLRAFTAFCLADAQSPFFAGENVPSAITSSQRMRPKLSSLRSRRAQTFWNTPDFVHSSRRRQQVAGDGKCFGKSFQRAPLLNTQTIPSRHGRGGTRGRPPAGDGGSSVNKSATKSHCSSVICDRRSVVDAVFHRPRRGHQDSVRTMRVSPFTRDRTHFPCHCR